VRVTRSGAVLAAVRSATPGMAAGVAAAAPFGDGPWLFSHNGLLDDWPASAAVIADRAFTAGGCDSEPPMTGPLPQPSGAAALLSLEAMVDSAFLWVLVLGRLRAGQAMGAALAETITAVEAAGGTGRFNFLLTDGHSIAATACGDTLWYRRSAGDASAPAGDAPEPAPASVTAASVTVASEPFDDEPGWAQVPDRHLLTATAHGVSASPFPADASTPVHQYPPTAAAR
jgi:gamma-glutamyl hercynylcysteine S-oxide hydrolase